MFRRKRKEPVTVEYLTANARWETLYLKPGDTFRYTAYVEPGADNPPQRLKFECVVVKVPS